jgi:membrane-bound lytic murein transglycosylase A
MNSPTAEFSSAALRFASFFFVVTLLVTGLTACEPKPPPPDKLVLKPVAFTDLPGWTADDQSAALSALLRTCARFARQSDDTRLPPAPADAGSVGIGGTLAEWREACAAAALVPANDAAAARVFFEARFRPFRAANNRESQGLFTGYYEAELRGSREPSAVYHVPLYRTPPDLVSVDLSDFSPEFAGRTIAGKVVKGKLKPYDDRAAIEKGSLKDRGLELIWVDDPVDAFFLQIQGSGRITLDDGTVVRVGYANKNGHIYTAIGRELVKRGVMTPDQVSMQSLRAWLEANPAEAESLMDSNRSYVFFREIPGAKADEGPLGAQSVPLTPGRSLAVDRKFVPLGVPVWLDAGDPDDKSKPRLRRLLIAQDTGGAIRGPVRGDVFWGWGKAAADRAGAMRDRGEYYILLPLPAAERVLNQPTS